MEKFDDLMSAVTFAEAGEHEKAKEFLKAGKTVLFAVSDICFERAAFRYALNIAERIGAALEILYVAEHGKEKKRLKDFVSEAKKEGFRFSVVVKEGCVKKEIFDYTKKRRDIQFVVVGSLPELDDGCRAAEKTLPAGWDKLGCPLVVVSKAGVSA